MLRETLPGGTSSRFGMESPAYTPGVHQSSAHSVSPPASASNSAQPLAPAAPVPSPLPASVNPLAAIPPTARKRPSTDAPPLPIFFPSPCLFCPAPPSSYRSPPPLSTRSNPPWFSPHQFWPCSVPPSSYCLPPSKPVPIPNGLDRCRPPPAQTGLVRSSRFGQDCSHRRTVPNTGAGGNRLFIVIVTMKLEDSKTQDWRVDRGQQEGGLADRSGTARRRIGGYIGDRKEDWRI
jgi:hypothetical protein